MKDSQRPLVNYVMGGLLFSLTGLFFKPLVGIFDPLQIAGGRALVAFIALFIFRIILGKSPRSLPLSFSKWQIFSAITLALTSICFAVAILNSSTADTFLICNATPVYMVLWQLLLEKKIPTKTDLIIVSAAAVGLIIFFFDSLSTASAVGSCAALAAGLSFAAHILAQNKVGKEGSINSEQFTFGAVLLGNFLISCVALPIALFFPQNGQAHVPYWSIGYIICLGIFQTAIPWVLWARSLPLIPPLIAAFMPTLIAVWAPTWTYLILGEPFPGILVVIGAIIIHAAVLIAALRKNLTYRYN